MSGTFLTRRGEHADVLPWVPHHQAGSCVKLRPPFFALEFQRFLLLSFPACVYHQSAAHASSFSSPASVGRQRFRCRGPNVTNLIITTLATKKMLG